MYSSSVTVSGIETVVSFWLQANALSPIFAIPSPHVISVRLHHENALFATYASYYVLGNVIEPIGRDYLYSELVNPIFIKDGDNVKVKVAVKFIDNQTKATQVSQYELVLHKDSNWKIVG